MAKPIGKPKTKKASKISLREFFRSSISVNGTMTNEEILAAWNKANPKSPRKIGAIKKERTLFEKHLSYDQQTGLSEFFSSQADLMLMQYRNIEQLLGPPDSNWTWPGEHCETLFRETIQRHLPRSLVVCKGYIHGTVKDNDGIHRSPEIDILIYDAEKFPPLFSMDNFAIVHPDSVVAAIQVKRTLDATTLDKAVQNVVASKKHVSATCQFNSYTTTQRMFTAVVSFEETIQKLDSVELSASYATAIKPHISEFGDGDFLPDFIGSLKGLFLHFPAVNTNRMLYQAFRSVQNDKNVALPFLLFMLTHKIRGYPTRLPPAFPSNMPVFKALTVWEQIPTTSSP